MTKVKVERRGRPRKYAVKKEKDTVYNKKRPTIRVSIEEKKVLDYLKENPDILKILSKNPALLKKVVTTKKPTKKPAKKVVTTKKPTKKPAKKPKKN